MESLHKKNIWLTLWFFFLTTSLFSFDVRVLLETTPASDLSALAWSIRHNYGFVVVTPQNNEITIPEILVDVAWNNAKQQFVVNNRYTLAGNTVEIIPCLSPGQSKKLKYTVLEWCMQYEKSIAKTVEKSTQTLFSALAPVKKGCLEKKESQAAVAYVQQMGHTYFRYLTNKLVDPVISYETLCARYDAFIADGWHDFFSKHLGREKTKKIRKHMAKDSTFCTTWFVSFFSALHKQFLTEFMLTMSNKLAHQILQEETGIMTYKKRPYSGSFVIHKEKENFLLINVLDINDYLVSVLHAECWPGWPLETHMVMAVACRTYLVSKILEARAAKRPYHIMNSIAHQTYNGHQNDKKLQQAVFATRDEFISYNGVPIVAMFDACCGGVVPAYITGSGINFKSHPYLARKKACTHCSKFKVANWKVRYTGSDLADIVPDVGVVKSMKVMEKDKAGLPTKIYVSGSLGKAEITGKKIYNLFPGVKSFCFGIKKIKDQFVIAGKGLGHHMGLCQWGAHALAQQKWDYKKILKFYYPGTAIMKLNYPR